MGFGPGLKTLSAWELGGGPAAADGRCLRGDPAPSAPGSWAAALPLQMVAVYGVISRGRPPSDSLSAWEPGGGPPPPLLLLVAACWVIGPACTRLALALPAHLLHHPATVPLSSGPIGAHSASTAACCQRRITDACHVPCHPLVEPSDNGPLFTELKFYQRAAKPEQIRKWIHTHKLKYLGVPKYWGSGLHDKNGKSYRFMIMDRFGSDLQKIYEANAKRFSRKTVLQLSLRILDILEYIHEHEYVHGDIKASNLLLSCKDPDQVYLVDYGLAYRYCPDGSHKEYKEDPKRCHDGTIEFTSIDAHNGVAPSRRGDLEILGYCMVQWLSGHLPWEDNLKDPNYIQRKIAGLMDKCFPEKNKPDEIAKYLETVKLLDYDEKPLYQNLQDILLQALKARTTTKKRKKEAEKRTEAGAEDMECSDAHTEEAMQTRKWTVSLRPLSAR
ncbi:hypothetical protein QTO34_020170 [Cnephaeus nilssonii]|uniref:non-specific serine/threonine protein kinase n=1 Tax=Cnephaeus nilssonii TaxID=3371016 RepID=A0AA40HY49_CNENI|nr:hypothetical protein QTO34_020170 [Eptesicus nilssonii]